MLMLILIGPAGADAGDADAVAGVVLPTSASIVSVGRDSDANGRLSV
jgi:hypothetical protein